MSVDSMGAVKPYLKLYLTCRILATDSLAILHDNFNATLRDLQLILPIWHSSTHNLLQLLGIFKRAEIFGDIAVQLNDTVVLSFTHRFVEELFRSLSTASPELLHLACFFNLPSIYAGFYESHVK